MAKWQAYWHGEVAGLLAWRSGRLTDKDKCWPTSSTDTRHYLADCQERKKQKTKTEEKTKQKNNNVE